MTSIGRVCWLNYRLEEKPVDLCSAWIRLRLYWLYEGKRLADYFCSIYFFVLWFPLTPPSLSRPIWLWPGMPFVPSDLFVLSLVTYFF